jgi:hypothetical protein
MYHVIGGYSNTHWSSRGDSRAANKAFLFALLGSGISSPCKMKLKDDNSPFAIYDDSSFGPLFGGGHDMNVSDF